jgi:DNA polymerase-3 subunit delta
VAKKRIYYAEFRRTLEQEAKPVYLFTGAETFLKEEGTQAIIDKVLPPAERNLNFESLYAGDISGTDVRERALTMPFFTSQRVILVRQVEKWRAPDVKALNDYVERPSDSTTLILSSQEERLKTEAWNTLAARAYHVECYPLFDNQVPDWVDRRSRDHGKRISRDAIHMLIERVGQSLTDLDNELGKLASYVGPKDAISDEDVKAAAGHLRQDTIHDLDRALGKKQWREAVRLANQLMEDGANAPQTLSSVAWHFRTLYADRLKYEKGDALDQVLISVRNPQMKQERAEQIKQFPAAEFPHVFRELLKLDEHVKTGKGHWELQFLLSILRWQKMGGERSLSNRSSFRAIENRAMEQ